MKFILLTEWLSPHQIPLAKEIVLAIGEENFRYVYLNEPTPAHCVWGWDKLAGIPWVEKGTVSDELVEEADVVLCGLRDFAYFERREKKGKLTLYMTERWFKPLRGIPGVLRLAIPRYFRMACRFARLVRTGRNFIALPIGVHALRDLALISGVRVVEHPDGSWHPMDIATKTGGMRMWGYFVAPSEVEREACRVDKQRSLRILWVGRFLGWKRVKDLIRAVRHYNATREEGARSCILSVYGDGPEKKRLFRAAAGDTSVQFHDFIPTSEVRGVMRIHDLYVLTSDGFEGWGATVSEALEEGLTVLGTNEAGASGTILTKSARYPAGDWRALSCLISGQAMALSSGQGIGNWSAAAAARALLAFVEQHGKQ